MARKENTIKKSGFAPIGVESLLCYYGVQKRKNMYNYKETKRNL